MGTPGTAVVAPGTGCVGVGIAPEADGVALGKGDAADEDAAADVAVEEIVTVRPSRLKLAITGIEALTVRTAFAVNGRRDGLAAKGKGRGGGRDQRFAREGQSQRAGFGGHNGVYRCSEMEDEPGRIVGG